MLHKHHTWNMLLKFFSNQITERYIYIYIIIETFLHIVNNHLIFRRVNCKRLAMQITQITVNIHISVFGRTIQLKRTSTTSYSVH